MTPSLLISLIGEQPIPNLLPIRHLHPSENLLVYTARTEAVAHRLRRLISPSANLQTDLRVEPYDFPSILNALSQRILDQLPVLINLTGGTKIMSLAAFALAQQRGFPFIYLENRASTLFHFHFQAGAPLLEKTIHLPELLTLRDYLLAHLDDYTLTGFNKDDQGNLTLGGEFEKQVCLALKSQLGQENVMAGVRPSGVAEQIEIDLAFRVGNQVGIAELKCGGKDSGKRALDQLKMAAEPTFLGTYTAQFLITHEKPSPKIEMLAQERNVTIITLPEYVSHQHLAREATQRLVTTIRNRLEKASS